MQDYIGEYDQPECRYLITKSTSLAHVVLGQPFLHNYYQIYNMDTNVVGLYQHQFSKAVIDEDGIDNRDDPTGLAPWAIALIVIAVLIVVGVIIAVVLIKKRNKRLGNQLVEYSGLEDRDHTRGEKSTL